MKQTAVEWLTNELLYLDNEFDMSIIDKNEYKKMRKKIVEQAKAMEKEQIIDAHGNKQKTKSNPNSIVTFGYTYTGEMYYNEKFKGIKPII